jgi:KAP family P-loop domain
VRAFESPTVLLLDAQWGTGKTTFIKMWLGELAKSRIPTIYFDAFANDYHDDAFLAVAGEIVARAEQLKPGSKRALQKFKDSAIGVAKALGRASVRIGIRTASAGLLTGEEVMEGVKIAADATKAAGDETAKAVDELLKERLESQKADRDIFDQFKTALGDLAGALLAPAAEAKSAGANDKLAGRAPPLVFVIDELDRCRPTFALELLEKIKHFFAVPGVTFVLVSSRSQLETAVCFAYGDIDARTYLEKFYHLRLLFPAGALDRRDTAAGTYLGHLQQEYSVNNSSLADIIERFSRIRALSLRTLERIFTYTSIAEISVPPDHLKIPYIISVLCIMKVLDPDLYETCRTGTAIFTEVDELMHFSRWRDEHDPEKRDRIGDGTENWWRYALEDLHDEELARQYHQTLAPYGGSHPSFLVPHFCRIIDGFSLPA